MEYPSLLWKNDISRTRDLFPVGDNGRVIPAAGPTAQSVLDDLLPAGAFGILSSTYFRFPCSAAEIPARQKLILRMAHDRVFSETIAGLAEKTASFEQLYNRLTAPELPHNQYVLLFPAVAREYLSLARAFAGFVPDDAESEEYGFAGEVQNHFRTILAAPQTAELERALDAFRKSRGEHVKLSLQGGMVTAYSASERYEDTLRQYFEEMGSLC